MTDIYEQLQTEADVEAEKIRPTKEESSLYGAKWLTVEDLLTDDKGYSKFAVDSAKAGGGGNSLPCYRVTIKNETEEAIDFQTYGAFACTENWVLETYLDTASRILSNVTFYYSFVPTEQMNNAGIITIPETANYILTGGIALEEVPDAPSGQKVLVVTGDGTVTFKA